MEMVRASLAAACLVLVTMAMGVVPSPASAVDLTAPQEYEVKAVFLYKFTKYVSWPPEAFHDGVESISICVRGPDPFGALLDDTLRGETVQERPLTARRLSRIEEASDCRVLFVSSGAEHDLPEILKVLEGKHVLTVGESPGFAAKGGMINLLKERSKIRFEINVDAAERAGLKISSQLLKLGKIVKSTPE